MITYKDYCDKLSTCLKNISKSNRQELINYYAEYAIDAGLTTYTQMEKYFGTPNNLASKIYAEMAIKELEVSPSKKGNWIKALWIGLIALLSLPMAFPLIVSIGAIFFALSVSFFAILFAMGVTIFTLGITSVALFIKSFTFLVPLHLTIWIKSFGGAVILGLITVCSLACLYYMTKWICKTLTILISKTVKRRANHE